MSALKVVCGKTGAEEVYDDDAEDERVLYDVSESNDSDRPFYWSSALQQSFREEVQASRAMGVSCFQRNSTRVSVLVVRIPTVRQAATS